MKKLLSLILALALAAGCLTALAAEDTSFTVTDMTGRDITLAHTATRVVALTASDVEILYALGAGETLVGRGQYCDYPAECLDIPAVNSGAETNIEEILALQPDVVIMATMAQTVEQVQALENAGVAVVVSDAQDIAGVYEAIRLIAAIVGKADEGEALIADMEAVFADIAAKAEPTGKTIYFEVSPLQWGLWTAGTGTFMDELAAMLGLTNAFADLEGWQAIDEETLIARDPDYIVTTSMYWGEGPTPVEEICSREGWGELKAIQLGQVFNADSDEVTRPGPRLVDAIEALYEFVYQPEEAEEEPAA